MTCGDVTKQDFRGCDANHRKEKGVRPALWDRNAGIRGQKWQRKPRRGKPTGLGGIFLCVEWVMNGKPVKNFELGVTRTLEEDN